MSTVINSINYQFNPDKDIQELCESIAKDLDGNGISLSDITIENASSKDAIVTTQFNWGIKVTLKSSVMSGKETKNITLHDSTSEAQAAAKKQGQYIIHRSLGKIELINNINEDPEHFYKHSSIKLNGGKSHAYIDTCDNQCDRGQVTCPRCRGIGTHKAITKKENLLGTTGNFAAINTCPDCKGKGTVNCSNCAGSGEIKRLFTVHVNAARKHRDTINSDDESARKLIESFLAHQSHKDLFKDYLSPVVSELKDIDKDHCSVTYKSKTKYSTINIKILDKNYRIIAFGDNALCIAKPKILDDILLPAINRIVGKNPKINSSAKCLKLQSMPIINLLLSTNKNRSPAELESLLKKHSNGLLGKDNTHAIIERLSLVKAALTPQFSIYAWFPFILAAMGSAFYFNLKSNSLTNTLIILAIHIIIPVTAGYLISKNITRFKRKKLNLKIDAPTLERMPALIASALIIITSLIPNLLSNDSRWSIFLKIQQYTNKTETNVEIISNRNLIIIAQKHLTALGYKNIQHDGNYNKETENAVNDFQKKFGIKETQHINKATMRLLTKYAVIRENYFNTTKE